MTPKTMGEGSPAIKKAMPTSAPWIKAVSPVPYTIARVTAAR